MGACQRLWHRRDAGWDRLLGRSGGGEGGVASYKGGRIRHQVRLRRAASAAVRSAVAADDAYVYIGTAAGLFRTRRGDKPITALPS